MNSIKDNSLLAAGVLIPCCACVAAWLADPWILDASWTLRLGVMGGTLVLAGASVALLVGRTKANRRALERHVEALCQFDAGDMSVDGSPDAPASLPADDPWSRVVHRLRDALEGYRRQNRDLKHAQTAWEIRSRRADTECERIKAILEGLAEPILAVDAFNELLLANPAAERLFQLDARNTDGRDVGQLVRCPKLVELLRSACQRKTTVSRSEEIEIVDAQGQPQWYRVSVSKLQSPDGDGEQEESGCHGAVAVLRDVGQEKALQKRHAEFVSSVSHEMKTPLAGIKAYVELLIDGEAEDDQTREEFLGVIDGQADRLQRLVENMLNLARIEAGVVSVNKKSRSLNELLEEAVHVVQPVAEAKPVELTAELSPMYLGVLADRDMLLQSAINLLSNAVKYTPPGGRVTLRSRLVGNEVAFEVEDTGVGLNDDDRQRVFEKFYRVKKDKNMASGTGLGLPLAKHIVEDVHGGRLTVDSTLGTGSTFSVVLPGVAQMA